MTKTDALRRFFFPCFHHTRTAPTPPSSSSAAASKKRLSTSLRDDLDSSAAAAKKRAAEPDRPLPAAGREPPSPSSSSSSSSSPAAHPSASAAAYSHPRSSRTMGIGTIFGHRRGGHVWFCIQLDRLSTRPTLLLELSIPTSALIQEMQCGLVRIALEFNSAESSESELSRCHLHSVPVWTLFCNGRKLGFAVRRKATRQIRLMLRTMQNITVGAGVLPVGLEPGPEIMYMRANYECVVGSADSESFHLINPDGGPSQELSVFLMRTR
ncbi:hypothetical protein STAS_33555 [Striga asiatica]|uniref:Protein MIZU-KUSSEI 1 n=1 Tax=Striga asiatica TaxID=4170 RepID=A0A5A7RFA8_STRAF|nr:hypothetical protein STAS_33555 [Striga asiatica]